MDCRIGCGACCIAPSIKVLDKPAGERCQYLDRENLCMIFNQPERPAVCAEFFAEHWVCGDTRTEAIRILTHLEDVTA